MHLCFSYYFTSLVKEYLSVLFGTSDCSKVCLTLCYGTMFWELLKSFDLPLDLQFSILVACIGLNTFESIS